MDKSRILVVDDNESLCKTLQHILRRHGFETTIAYSGNEALAKARMDQFDLAFLDIKLPDIDGTELLTHLAKLNPDMGLVIITGNATIDTAVKALEKQAVAYMTKPLDMDKLLDIVTSVVEKQRLIREKNQAEEALKQSETRIRTILDSLGSGVLIIDQETRQIMDANPAALELIGAPKDQVVGEVCHKHICIAEYCQCPILDLNQSVDVSERILLASGERQIPILKTVNPVNLGDRPVLIESFVDITERKHAQLERLQQQRETELYASLLKHDISNDLQIIIGNLECVQAISSDICEEAQEMLESSVVAADRMARLISVISRSGFNSQKEIVPLLEKTASEAEKAHVGLAIRIHANPETYDLSVEKAKLLPMVFENLFRNSAKYAGESTSIDVHVTCDEDNIIIKITDDGPGVSPQIREKLFQKGVTTNGTGYGLYLCKRIVDTMGGAIEYTEDENSSGASFKIMLPFSQNTTGCEKS
jgi:PAS domain S-box-containing protein